MVSCGYFVRTYTSCHFDHRIESTIIWFGMAGNVNRCEEILQLFFVFCFYSRFVR